MRRESEISCVVPGSFKFKDTIDEVITEFEDLGVAVLAPDKGWLVLNNNRKFLYSFHDKRFGMRYYTANEDFRPIPTEIDLHPKEIENLFLSKILEADFIYLVNKYEHFGDTTAMELGFALEAAKPVYAMEPLTPIINDPDTLLGMKKVLRQIKILTPEEAVKDFKTLLSENREYYERNPSQ